ncbi:MAG: SPOR domain-containing protein [Marinirhabdus sp.]|nr:SPOR domain-containing protein [Marinirhabdus sp.]
MFVSMHLATYISDLLYRYECVIVPGFGAFITRYHSARIDSDTHEFFPPGKTVMFNRQLQTNDGILANYVASVEKCSYALALQKIRNFAGKLSLDLSEGNTVHIDSVGSFVLNEERSVQFNPEVSGNFSTAAFGLSSFITPTVTRELQPQQTVVAAEEKKVLALETRPRTAPYMKYAAVGLIALALAGFGGMKLYEGEVQEHNFAEKQKAENLVESQIQEATFIIENPLKALNITVPKHKGKYHIVAGAFRIEANAQKKVRQLDQKGYSAKMIGVNKYGLHQVVYSSHQDRLEALRTLRNIQSEENSAAWLLVKDLNN